MSRCTCEKPTREEPFVGACDHCEQVVDWEAGRAGHPSCETCSGNGSYPDGDVMVDCECVAALQAAGGKQDGR